MTTKKPPSTEVVVRPATPSATPRVVQPLDPEIDLPVGRGVILMQVPKMGWTVLEVEIQGSRVISSEVVVGPVSKAEAMENVKLRTVRFTLAGAL